MKPASANMEKVMITLFWDSQIQILEKDVMLNSACYTKMLCNKLKPMVQRKCHGQIYRVSQEECARLREGVPYVKIYRYNPKHLCPKLNGYGDNGQRKVCSSVRSTHYTYQLTACP
jgi:hypothetical protein